MRKYNLLLTGMAAILSLMPILNTYAMEAPGNGGKNWKYDQETYDWYYLDQGREPHIGWLKYDGEWYWFDDQGRMKAGGSANIDGRSYYFFINGNMAWNQYVGLKYYDEDGQPNENHDIRVIGSERPESEDKDMLSDFLYQIPRTWIRTFARSGWEFMFYKKKRFFAAPNTDQGIYYVYHDVDLHYQKVKFTDVDSLLQAFGEYVGYAAGCYQDGSVWMKQLLHEQKVLDEILKIPDYYKTDEQFYFGKVFAAYMDEKTRIRMHCLAPESCRVIEEILRMKEDPKTREKLLQQDRLKRESAAGEMK